MDSSASDSFRSEREKMVNEQLIAREIVQQSILSAFSAVPRHRFVPERYKDSAYKDVPLPIGHSQTISQPFVIAYMLQKLDLKKGDRVLEIGTGSGYQTAVLCEMGCDVYTVELIEELAQQARKTLSLAGYRDIEFKTGDGRCGFSEGAPYDAIVVSAASENIPDALTDQLKSSGSSLIIPVGKQSQQLALVKKKGKSTEKQMLILVQFVRLV